MKIIFLVRVYDPSVPPVKCLERDVMLYEHVWQSRVEVKHYSVNRVTAFEVLKHNTSVKGRTHSCCILSGIDVALLRV